MKKLFQIVILLYFPLIIKPQSTRDCVLTKANDELGTIETSENSGPKIDIYIAEGGFKTPVPWCGLYLRYIFSHCNANYPLYPARAASWTMENTYKNKYDAQSGDVFTIYYSSKGRVGHTGIIETTDADYVYTIEGNTNSNILDGGDYNGDRVMKKLRPWTTIYRTANWIGDNYYTVKPGDTLYRISLTNKVSIEKLKKLNNIKENYIKVGQKLQIS